MPRKKGNKPMPQTSPATPPAVPQATPVELDKTQKLQHEFQVLLNNIMARAQELGIEIRYGPLPKNGGAPFGHANGCSSFELDGIHFTGQMVQGKIGVVFLPKKAFAVGDKVIADGAGPGSVAAYSGRSPASGLPEWQVQLESGGTRNFRQDQLK